jgi:hypothetical protein
MAPTIKLTAIIALILYHLVVKRTDVSSEQLLLAWRKLARPARHRRASDALRQRGLGMGRGRLKLVEKVVDGESIPWPVALGGDKGYRADRIDRVFRELHITPGIRRRKTRTAPRG